MNVVGLPEFLRCVQDATRTERDHEDIAAFLHRLAARHMLASMRAASIRIGGTSIQLWATDGIRLSGGVYRVTWRYEERGAIAVIVCFTLAET